MPKPDNISPITYHGLHLTLHALRLPSRATPHVSPLTYHDGRLGKAIARVVGKPGIRRFRLARDTVGVMVERFAMPSIEGQKKGAVIMENGLAERHAQRSVLGLVTRLGK